jgi:archaellum component FlaC
MMVDSKEERTSQILDEVGRMEVWMDSVGDRVRNVKTKLDDMEEEGGVILNLKDANTK